MADKRFVLLDRDGTIVVERNYLSDPDGLELLPQAAEGLRRMKGMGLGLVVITNQSGVARGILDIGVLEEIHARLRHMLGREGIQLDGIYYCPHMPDTGCTCRKPSPGLALRSSRELGFSLSDCFVIGDKASDINLGRNIGAGTFLVRTGYGTETVKERGLEPDYVVDDLVGAAHILSDLLKKH